MGKKARTLILRTAGTNCDGETKFAFEDAGSEAELVHINRLLSGERKLKDYHILAIPGGFTYGDDIAAGKILANELRLKFADDLRKFVSDGKLIIGICNGFQMLVKAGLLPGPLNGSNNDFKQNVTLMNNDCGKFEDRWIYLKPAGRSVWTEGVDQIVNFPVAHGEGKFVPLSDDILKKIKSNNQIVFRYCDSDGNAPKYPDNPNGSVEHIAGITDQTGRVFGLMPHPERHYLFVQNPKWTRLKKKSKYGDGARIFQNGVEYVKKNLLK